MREVVIRKPITFILLLAVTATIAMVTVFLAGKSYESLDPFPFDDLKSLARRLDNRPITTHLLAVIVVPIIINVLLFVPFGFLTFILFYSVERPTLQTYVLAILFGFSLTLVIEAWQYFTPSRVADVNDVIWNTIGTILGALLGHARLRVRVEFE